MSKKTLSISIITRRTGLNDNGIGYRDTPINFLNAAETRAFYQRVTGDLAKQVGGLPIDTRANSAPLVGNIIVFPEFFLQPRLGAYSVADKDTILANIRDFLQTYGRTDILMVYGTIVYHDRTNNRFYNDLLYSVGKTLYKTSKHYVSGIDVMREGNQTGLRINPDGYLCGRALVRCPNNIDTTLWNESANQNHTINFKNIKIGFNVCLDYNPNNNYDNILYQRLQPSERNTIDLHIVPSAGMQFKDNIRGLYKKVAKVIICDSMAEGNWSSVSTVTEWGVRGASASINITRTFNPVEGLPPFTVRHTEFTVDA